MKRLKQHDVLTVLKEYEKKIKDYEDKLQKSDVKVREFAVRLNKYEPVEGIDNYFFNKDEESDEESDEELIPVDPESLI